MFQLGVEDEAIERLERVFGGLAPHRALIVDRRSRSRGEDRVSLASTVPPEVSQRTDPVRSVELQLTEDAVGPPAHPNIPRGDTIRRPRPGPADRSVSEPQAGDLEEPA